MWNKNFKIAFNNAQIFIIQVSDAERIIILYTTLIRNERTLQIFT